MKLKNIVKIMSLSFLLVACDKPKDEFKIEITDHTTNAGYIGNGAEWDPYDEALCWGAKISDEDWNTIFKRLDFMRMGYVRCMINSPFVYYDKANDKYDKTRNIESVSKLLKYCTDNNITVMYGEYNPPSWDRKTDPKWVEMSVDYLNYLVNDLGFSCIKYFVIFNEPDGDWASTNGDYDLWKGMLLKFAEQMKKYPGLSEKVKFAAPDVVADYKNNNSKYDAEGWVKQTATDLDSLVGVYDIHAYPGQAEVRNGSYENILAKYKNVIPADKKILVGELGFKYWREADSLLMAEYRKRADAHPFTKGSDSNMFLDDHFYGLDMPMVCMEIMNAGYSGVAAWMLDDAMHSNDDGCNLKDIKVWGMWNSLGAEVFGDPKLEEPKPWFYTWSLMCRYFPAGSNIKQITFDRTKGIFAAAAEKDGKHTIAIVNVSDKDQDIEISHPFPMQNAQLFVYEENNSVKDADLLPLPSEKELKLDSKVKRSLKAQSFVLYTTMN